MELAVPVKLLIALVLGAAIGLEREIHEIHEEEDEQASPIADIAFIGVRTLSLTTALGAIAGVLFESYFTIFMLLNISLMVLLGIHYILSGWLTRDIGITTELAMVYCYLIGLFIGLEALPIQLILGITVVLMLILSNKEWIKNTVDNIRRRELKAVIGWGIIALVILPSLPNEAFTLEEIPYMREMLSAFGMSLGQWADLEVINPFTMWLIVAIFTGVDLIGYILERTIGQGKGLLITSLVGGFVSSTATTQSLAAQSKESKQTDRLVGAALIATFASFFSVALIVLPLNPLFIARILPTLLILIISFAIAGYFFLKRKNGTDKAKLQKKKEKDDVFSLKPALTFALLYVAIKLVSKIALELFGQSGFLATSALAGFTGIDAVSINIAELMRNEAITPFTAVLAFIIVNAVNLIAKTIYIFLQGTRAFAMKYGMTIAVIIALSCAGLLFV